MKENIIMTLVAGLVGGLLVLVFQGLVGGNQSDLPGVGASGTRFPNGISVDSTSPSAGELRSTTLTTTGAATLQSTLGVTGATTLSSTLAVTGATTLSSTLSYLELSEAVTASNTITSAESGTTYYVSGAAATSTLPAVATATGTVFTFVVSAALSADGHTILSAEGDNMEGSVVVNGSHVDVDAADRVYFSASAENLGDIVRVRSDGQKWFVDGSGFNASSILADG